MKYKIMALIGEAGSGKDTVLQKILEKNPNLHEVIPFTTRPPREKEKDGVNYYFISEETFTLKLLQEEFLEVSHFNDWFYGTGFESLRSDCVNIGVFNPQSIESIMALGKNKVDLIVFYIETTPKNRLLRQLNREENPDVYEIIRRFKADDEDFYELNFLYNTLENNTLEELEETSDYIAKASVAFEGKQY